VALALVFGADDARPAEETATQRPPIDIYPRPDRDRRGERLIQVQRLQRVAAQEAGYYFVCSFSSPAGGGRRPGASFVPTEGRNAHDPRPWCKMHAVLLVCGAQGTQTESGEDANRDVSSSYPVHEGQRNLGDLKY